LDSFSSLPLAVALSGTESGRPLFVRGIRITLLGRQRANRVSDITTPLSEEDYVEVDAVMRRTLPAP